MLVQRMHNNRHTLIRHAALIVIGIPFLIPFVWMVVTSLRSNDLIFSDKLWPILRTIEWRNYPEALRSVPFGRYLFNTLFLCLANVIGATLSCSLVGYGFAKIEFPFRKQLFLLMIATIILPSQVTMIPLFILFSKLGWYGGFLPLIVPHYCGSAFFIFLLRQFYLTIPRELSEAAKIDGCSEWGIWWRIMLPLVKPALATVALFTFLGTWNDFSGPLIYLNDQSKYTLAYGLQQFLGAYGSQWAQLMAASTVFTLPIILLFFLLQRVFIKGVVTTGLKG
jgi:multiple sugar transport system permease protein